PGDDLNVGQDVLGRGGVARRDDDAVPAFLRFADHVAADEPRAARDQQFHRRGFYQPLYFSTMDLRKLASILRRKTHVGNLLKDLADEIFAHASCDGMRFDLSDDRGGLWSRIIKRGQDPERPSLGAVV